MENSRYTRNRRREQERIRQRKAARRFLLLVLLLLIAAAFAVYFFVFRDHELNLTKAYDPADQVFGINQVELSPSQASGFASGLCVANEDYNPNEISLAAGAAGLFSEDTHETLYAKSVHERMYPASLTKIMTCLVALKYGNLDDVVTVGQECYNIASDSSVANIIPGDQLTLRELLYGLMINSGNDAGMSIAVYIAGSVDAYVDLMNQEAAAIGATNTHFMNPHGLHDENHYTTVYDVYLMFHEALKYTDFQEIIGMHNYYITIPNIDGTSRDVVWESTNYYSNGNATAPGDVQVVGGKTGTTSEAGACLCLYSKDRYGSPYISIIMNAATHDDLYSQMNVLLREIP